MGRNEKQERMRERICRALDLYPDTFGSESYVQIRGRGYVSVSGCLQILEYTPQRICLSLKHGSLAVEGESLICTSYLAGGLGIEGRVACVRFEEEV